MDFEDNPKNCHAPLIINETGMLDFYQKALDGDKLGLA
jgi:hypothetical protein